MFSYWFYGVHGPLTRYVKLRVAHAPGMPGTFSLRPLVNDPDMHHGTCVTHVPWCMSGWLTSGFLWSQWRGKRSRHSRRRRNPQFCVSGKRPINYEHLVVYWLDTHATVQLSIPSHELSNGLSKQGTKYTAKPNYCYYKYQIYQQVSSLLYSY